VGRRARPTVRRYRPVQNPAPADQISDPRQCGFTSENDAIGSYARWSRLPRRSRSAHRTRSPAAVSQKREYFKCPPETIGYSARKLPELGVWRHTTNLQKPAIGGPFRHYRGSSLQASDKRKRKASTVLVRCHRRSGMLLLASISRGRCPFRRENLFDRKGRGTYFGSEAIHETVR
jgi:hypothetical protein